jgi:hypothetical protein
MAATRNGPINGNLPRSRSVHTSQISVRLGLKAPRSVLVVHVVRELAHKARGAAAREEADVHAHVVVGKALLLAQKVGRRLEQRALVVGNVFLRWI